MDANSQSSAMIKSMLAQVYGRQSADRTKPLFDVILFVYLSTFFDNLDVCYAKTCNIF